MLFDTSPLSSALFISWFSWSPVIWFNFLFWQNIPSSGIRLGDSFESSLIFRLITNSAGDFPPSIWFPAVQNFKKNIFQLFCLYSLFFRWTSSSTFLCSVFLSWTPWTAFRIHFWFQRKIPILHFLNTAHFQSWFHFCDYSRIWLKMLLSYLLLFWLNLFNTSRSTTWWSFSFSSTNPLRPISQDQFKSGWLSRGILFDFADHYNRHYILFHLQCLGFYREHSLQLLLKNSVLICPNLFSFSTKSR